MRRIAFATAALSAALAAASCDAVRVPGVEPKNSEPETGDPNRPPPPPPTEPVPGRSIPGPTDPVETADPGQDPVPEPDREPIETGGDDPASDDASVDEDAPSELEPDLDPPTSEEPVAEEPPASPPAPVAPAFSYHPPGALLPGSGSGAPDDTVFAPDMVFPIRMAAAYPQSQVWTFGGGVAGGDQCDPRNYQYPWRDNFCERRSSNFNSPYCPNGRVHLGQDIRVGTPEGCNELRRTPSRDRALYAVVAAEDGVISNIGSYTVNVRAGSRIYRYLHLNMRALQVSLNEEVQAGQIIGYVSNDFGGTPTTFHLHFEIKQNTAEHGWAFVPPYTSLVKAYERREDGPGEVIEQSVAIAASPMLPPEDAFIYEGFVSDQTVADAAVEPE